MLARVIEAAGIPTVTVTMMPILAEKYRTSRILGVEFPFGHSFGLPGDIAMQRETLLAALDLLATAVEPGTVVHHGREWPIDRRTAYKSWQPSEPSPIVAQSMEAIRQARRQG